MGKLTSIVGDEEFRSPCTPKRGILIYYLLGRNGANSPVMHNLVITLLVRVT